MNPLSLDTFTDKLGPLPVWAWAGIGGVGLAAIAFLSKGKSAGLTEGEVILQPGANAQGNEGEFGYGAGFDPGSIATGDGGTGGTASPAPIIGGSEGGSGGFSFTDGEPVSAPTSEPTEYNPPVYETVTAGSWTGLVTAAAGIPVSSGVDMSDLDASLAAIGIVAPPGGWPDAGTSVATVAANTPAPEPYPMALDPGYATANIYATDVNARPVVNATDAFTAV